MKGRTDRYTNDNVLFPFGFGLTYGDVKCTAVSYKDGVASVTATNGGSRATEDVIELYIKNNSEFDVPNESLCGFKRVNLAAGETVTVEIPVPERAFTSVDEQGKRARFGTEFTLYAGTHRPDALSCKLSGSDCVSVQI